MFLENSFMGFKFPNLTSFLSLMPDNRRHQVCVWQPKGKPKESLTIVICDACVPYSWWTQCLHRILAISSVAPMLLTTMRSCALFTATTWRRRCSWRRYVSTALTMCWTGSQQSCWYKSCLSSPQESLPAVVRRPTLPCVWLMALSSSKRSEVNRWFDQSLKNYLVFLTKSLINPKITYNSSCVAFQKLYVTQPRYYKMLLFLWVHVRFPRVFQCLCFRCLQLHCCRLWEARHVQHHQGLPDLR